MSEYIADMFDLTVLVKVWHHFLMRLLFLASGSPVAIPLMTDSSSWVGEKDAEHAEMYNNDKG